MMEQLDIRRAEISKRTLHLKTEEESLAAEKKKAESTYKSVSSSIESMNAECVRLDEEVQKLQDRLKEQNRQMETGQTAYHREASRLESLKNLTERYDGYGKQYPKGHGTEKTGTGYPGRGSGYHPGTERL